MILTNFVTFAALLKTLCCQKLRIFLGKTFPPNLVKNRILCMSPNIVQEYLETMSSWLGKG